MPRHSSTQFQHPSILETEQAPPGGTCTNTYILGAGIWEKRGGTYDERAGAWGLCRFLNRINNAIPDEVRVSDASALAPRTLNAVPIADGN